MIEIHHTFKINYLWITQKKILMVGIIVEHMIKEQFAEVKSTYEIPSLLLSVTDREVQCIN